MNKLTLVFDTFQQQSYEPFQKNHFTPKVHYIVLRMLDTAPAIDNGCLWLEG